MTDLINHALEANLLAEALRHHARYVARAVDPDDYGDPAHRVIALAVDEVASRELVTFDSVAIELQRSGMDGFVGGARGLAQVAAAFADMVPDHQELRRLRRLRDLRESALQVVKAAEAGRLDEALALAASIDQATFGIVETLTVSDLAERTLQSMQSRAPRAHLGLRAMHQAIGELPVGSVMTIGADTNVGKTTVALEMLFAAAQDGGTVGFVSVEDPEDVTGARMLSMQSGLSSRKLQRRLLHADDFHALASAIDALKLMGARLLYEDHTGGNDLDVCAAMTRMAQRGARLIVVDYIQEIDASKRQQDRRNEIRWILRRLKSYARRLGVALVLVSQLARPKEDGKTREPGKHSLKEAGDLENASEVVLVLWRESEDDFADINVKVAKCKWGGVGQRWRMRRHPVSGRLQEVGDVSTGAVGGQVVRISPHDARGRDQ